MRLYSIHLVAAIALFACVEASALESQPKPTLPETSGHGHTPDQTFPQNGTNSVDEERMPSSNVVRVMKGAAHSMESLGSNFAERAQQLKEELKGKSAQEAFAYLKLHEAGDDDLSHWKYFSTGAQGEDTYEAMAEVLLARFSNARLVKMLHATEKVEETKVIARKPQKARFVVWARECEKELGLTSLKRLGPDLKSDDLFHNAASDAWDKYANSDDVVYIEHKMLLRVLLDRYDEFDLAKAFHAAMEIDELKSTAKRLQLHLNWHWTATKPSYEDMFVKLGLDPTKDGFVGSPLFRTWYQHVKIFGHYRDSAVVKILKDRLGDFGLAKMLDAAKKVASTKATAIDLEKAYILLWRNDDPKLVFKNLRLDAKSRDLLGIPLFKIWYKYAKEKRSTVEVMEILRARMGDDGFAAMLDAAKKVASTKAIAIELEKAFISPWQRKFPNAVFEDFRLNAKSRDLLGIPLFKMWHKYAKEEWSTLEMALFLRARMGDAGFAKMLDAAKKDYSTKAIAIELEKAFTPQWRYDDPNRIFVEVGLDATSDDLLANPLFKTWCKYMDWNWSLSKAVEILKDRLGDFIFAEMLEAGKKVDVIFVKLEKAYIHGWDGEHPDRVFNELGLDAKSDGLLGIPLFKTWYKYAEEEISTLGVVKILESRLERFNFAKMLDAATKADDTKKIALELQATQFDYWDRSRVSEAEVNEKTRPVKSFMKIRKREVGQSASAGDYTVGWKYGEYRQKKNLA